MRTLGIVLSLALLTSAACILDWPAECDPANNSCEQGLICEAPYPDQDPHFGYCVAPLGDAGQEFQCDGGITHPPAHRCDNKFDCRDGLDEVGCGDCNSVQIKCPGSSTCRPKSDRCNTIANDCPGNTDENGCTA